MPQEITPDRTNFFPVNNRALQTQSGLVYLSSPYPSVQYESLDIATDLENSGDAQSETISVTLNITLNEAIRRELAADQEFTRWYNTPDYFSNIRIRVIGCFSNRNSFDLDFISQRMNEYQAGLASYNDENAEVDFYSNLRTSLGDDSNLLSPIGPFGAEELLDSFKNNSDRVFYSPNSFSPLSDIVVYDVPIGDVLRRNSAGAVLLGERLSPVAKNNSANGAEDFPRFFNQKILLNPITFSFGKNETYSDTRLENIRFYAFTYMDYGAFMESRGMRANSGTARIEKPLISTGVGFISPGIFKGEQNIFKKQEAAPLVTPPRVLRVARTAPLEKNVRDRRQYGNLKLVDVKEQLYKDYSKVLRRLGGEARVGDIIKDENYFSNFWVTKCENDNARYGFVFDKLGFLIKNSRFPWLYSNPLIVNEMFNGGGMLEISSGETAKVLNVSMTKRQIKEHRTIAVNDLTFGRSDHDESTYYRPEEVVDPPQFVSNMQFPQNTQDTSRLNFYEGYDTYADDAKTQTQGTYQYGVSVDVLDPSILYLRKMSLRLRKVQRNAMEIHDMIINSPPSDPDLPRPKGQIKDGVGLYDRLNDKVLVPLNKIAIAGSTAETILEQDIQTFISLYARVITVTSLSYDAIGTMLSGLVGDKDPDGIKSFSEIVALFKQSIDRVLDSWMPKDPFGEGTTLPAKIDEHPVGKDLPVLSTKKYFSQLFEFGQDYEVGYLYLSRQAQGDIENRFGLPTYSRQFFSNRVQEEFNKYFSPYTEGNSVSNEVDPQGTTFQDSSYQYFSPKAIKIFGKEPLVQTDYKAIGQNIAAYDLNRYGELFSDLVKRKNISVKQNLPFYSIQAKTQTTKQLFNSLGESLQFHACQITEGIKSPFGVPSPSNVKGRVIKVGQEGHDKDLMKGDGLVGAILGGNSDPEESVKAFLKNTDSELNPSATGSYGSVVDPSFKDKDIDIQFDDVGLPPIKLTFGIIGELELNPIIDQVTYQKEMFNSMVNNINSLGLDDQSVAASVQNLYRQMPNQLKSMFVVAASQAKKQLTGNLDAVRFQLEDVDKAPFAESISYISEDDEFPPYKTTRDPMKIYSKFLAFWMNYKQLGVIEYLSGFNNLEVRPFADRGVDIDENNPVFTAKPLLPVWRKFTLQDYQNTSGGSLLCRVRTFVKDDVPVLVQDEAGSDETPAAGKANNINSGVDVAYKDLFDLPIYNRYFVLRG